MADGDADGSRCPPRPAGGRRCTLRRNAAASAPAWSCSSAAPIRPSRPTTGKRRAAHKPRRRAAHTLSVEANASPLGTRTQPARRVRRGGGAGAAAASPRSSRIARRSPPPASSRTPRVHSRGAACRGRVLRRTPTHPRHDLRVALRASHRSHRTAADRARTYRIAANSAGRRNASRTHGHVARDALRVWLRVRSVVSREWCCRPNSSARRRPRCVRSVRPLAPVLESTIRPLRPKDASHARVHSAHSAQLRL